MESELEDTVAKRSVIVWQHYPKVSKDDLRKCCEPFGEVEDVILQNTFAIIRFFKQQSADRILRKGHILFEKKKMFVKKYYRRVTRPESQPKNLSDVAKKSQELHEDNYTATTRTLLLSANSAIEQFDILCQLRLSEDDIAERERIRIFFDDLFAQFFVYSKTYIFGSTQNGLGLSNCDIDLHLALNTKSEDQEIRNYPKNSNKSILEHFRKNITKKEKKINIKEFEKLSLCDIVRLIAIILKDQKQCSDVIVIPATCCPIVTFKFCDKISVLCDMSIKNRLAVYNSRFIALCTKLDSRVTAFLITIRLWVTRNKLEISKANRLTSYACSVMSIFFLQCVNPPVLPTIQILRSYECKNRVISGYDCSYCSDVGKISPSQNNQLLPELISEFFHFYSQQFNLSTHVVNVLTGKALSKEEFQSTNPDFRFSHLNVVDPFETSRNITGNVDEKLTQKFFKLISNADEKCSSHNFWKPKKKVVWGLAALLDDTTNEEQRTSHVTDSSSSNTKESISKKRKPDQEAHVIISSIFLISSSQHFQSLLSYSPPSTSSSSQIVPTDKSCFNTLCGLLKSIFEKSLLFKCTATPSTTDNEKSVTQDRKKRRITKTDSTQSSDEENDDCQLQSSPVTVQVFGDVWSNRIDVIDLLSSSQHTVIERERKISKKLIGDEIDNPQPLLMQFMFTLMLYQSKDLYCDVVSESGDSKLTNNLFEFLENYIQKILTEIFEKQEY